MYKKANFLVPALLLFFAVVGSHAQVGGKRAEAEAAKLQAAITKAMDSAVYENGRIKSLKVSLPNDRERVVRFEHPEGVGSFTMVDDKGQRITVSRDEYGPISSIIFPDRKKANFDWLMMPTGYWVPTAIKVDGKDLSRSNALVETDDSCYEICQAAAAASAIAVGQCIASGPTSTACYSALATAAFATYRCYRCSNPQVEWPPES